MKRLLKAARDVRKKAYAPYSKFLVGAALETTDGKIFTGCNVENASYGLAICAERSAIFNAVSHGAQRFRRIVIVADVASPATPCGACRQVLHEFAPKLEIISANLKGKTIITTLNQLLPQAFELKSR